MTSPIKPSLQHKTAAKSTKPAPCVLAASPEAKPQLTVLPTNPIPIIHAANPNPNPAAEITFSKTTPYPHKSTSPTPQTTLHITPAVNPEANPEANPAVKTAVNPTNPHDVHAANYFPNDSRVSKDFSHPKFFSFRGLLLSVADLPFFWFLP